MAPIFATYDHYVSKAVAAETAWRHATVLQRENEVEEEQARQAEIERKKIAAEREESRVRLHWLGVHRLACQGILAATRMRVEKLQEELREWDDEAYLENLSFLETMFVLGDCEEESAMNIKGGVADLRSQNLCHGRTRMDPSRKRKFKVLKQEIGRLKGVKGVMKRVDLRIGNEGKGEW
jgi:hypothetical protein